MIKCKICNQECSTTRGLAYHVRIAHNLNSKDYYDMYLKQENEGKCLECGKQTSFRGIKHGYSRFCCSKCTLRNSEVRDKQLLTQRELYGEHLELIQKKTQETNLKKYGKRHVLQVKAFKEKGKQTSLIKYGTNHPSQSNIVKEKSKQTNLKKYSVEYTFQSDNNKEKSKETMIQKYGELYSKTEECLEKTRQTNLEKYGVEHPWKLNKENNPLDLDIEFPKDKGFKTMKENGTFNSSKPEKELEIELRKLFPDLKTQYKSEEYTFVCDFYIPSLDLYIEYNGIWTHGGCFYDENNEDNRNTLEKWKQLSEHSDFYQSAIDTWTRRDLNKLNTALKNHLNYVAWFNQEQALDWINKFKRRR